jgi:DNA-binding response OmpR family regulator
MNENILLVEDEAALRTALQVRLRSEGYLISTAADGEEGLEKALTMHFDLIILDVMLPHRSGLEVCRDLRQLGMMTPILMLTVRSRTLDKIVGFTLGADDYVTKPYEADELLARIEALLRRVPVQKCHSVHEYGSIRVDLRSSEVTRDGKPVALTAREFQLLRYLMERAGSTVPRIELLRSVWGYEGGVLTRTVDFHVGSLRQKLEPNPRHPELIVTVSKVGYKFMGAPASTAWRASLT